MVGTVRKVSFSLAIFFSGLVSFATAQEVIPVFKTTSDSIAYYTIQNAMRTHDPLATKLIRMDSLWEVQQRIVRTGILGWKYTYKADPTFVSLENLVTGNVAAKD